MGSGPQEITLKPLGNLQYRQHGLRGAESSVGILGLDITELVKPHKPQDRTPKPEALDAQTWPEGLQSIFSFEVKPWGSKALTNNSFK